MDSNTFLGWAKSSWSFTGSMPLKLAEILLNWHVEATTPEQSFIESSLILWFKVGNIRIAGSSQAEPESLLQIYETIPLCRISSSP